MCNKASQLGFICIQYALPACDLIAIMRRPSAVKVLIKIPSPGMQIDYAMAAQLIRHIPGLNPIDLGVLMSAFIPFISCSI